MMMLKFRDSTIGPMGLLLSLAIVTCLCQTSQATYRQYQQQSNQQLQQQAAALLRYYTDLVNYASSADLPSPTLKSLSHKLAAKENQINEKSGSLPVFKSGSRAVINGNHATYVEPPADFKPIIYDWHSRVAPSQNTAPVNSKPDKDQASSYDPPATSSGESFIESPNHLVASMLPPTSGQSLSRQQQKRQILAHSQQQQQQVLGEKQRASSLPEQQHQQQQQQQQQQQSGDTQNGREPESSNNDDVDDESNSLPMKPSIDRWSDWHDMSVDPDLASSETQQSTASALPLASQTTHQSNPRLKPQHRQQPQAHQEYHPGAANSILAHQAHQLRKHDAGIQSVSSFPREDHLQRFPVVPLINQLYQQQQEQQQRMLTANLIKMHGMDPASAASYEQNQDYFYQATQPLHRSSQQRLQASNANELHHSYQQRPSMQHMPLLYHMPQHPQPQQQQQPQMAHSNFVMAGLAAPTPSAMLAIPQKLQQPRAARFLTTVRYEQQQQQPAVNKKMTNLFRATTTTTLNENHHIPELMTLGQPEQARKFRSQTVPSTEVKLVAEHQHRRDHRLSAPLILSPQQQEVSSGLAAAYFNNKQVSSPVSGAGNGGSQAKATASRVLTPHGGNLVNKGSSRPASSGVAPTAAAAATTTLPAQLTATNATANPSQTATASPKRVLKRRRIKTLLPVGLSSWLLGGIRDLDARHWKLPNEIMTKLAINDVDLQHPEQANGLGSANQQPTATSNDESSSVVNMSNQVQTGGSIERADQPRTSATRAPSSSSQMSPR